MGGFKTLVLKYDLFDARYVRKVRTTTAETTSYTILANDDIILADSASPITFTLPEASGSGITYIVKNINSGSLLLDGDGTDQVDGGTGTTLAQWESVTVLDYSTGQWITI